MQQQSQQQQQDAKNAANAPMSNVPVRKECVVPGRTCWMLWRTLFEIDEVCP